MDYEEMRRICGQVRHILSDDIDKLSKIENYLANISNFVDQMRVIMKLSNPVDEELAHLEQQIQELEPQREPESQQESQREVLEKFLKTINDAIGQMNNKDKIC